MRIPNVFRIFLYVRAVIRFFLFIIFTLMLTFVLILFQFTKQYFKKTPRSAFKETPQKGFVEDTLQYFYCRSILWVTGLSVQVIRFPSASSSNPRSGETKSINLKYKKLGFFPKLDFSGQNFLLQSNHLSYMDIMVLGSIYPLSFLAKSEIASWPGLGFCGKSLGCLFVKRGNLGQKVRSLRELTHRIETQGICVFPEGTTTANVAPSIEKWEAGSLFAAKINKCPLILTAISYENRKEIAWIDDESFLPHLWKLLLLPKSKVTIVCESFANPFQSWNELKSPLKFEIENQTKKRSQIRQISRWNVMRIQQLADLGSVALVTQDAEKNLELHADEILGF